MRWLCNFSLLALIALMPFFLQADGNASWRASSNPQLDIGPDTFLTAFFWTDGSLVIPAAQKSASGASRSPATGPSLAVLEAFDIYRAGRAGAMALERMTAFLRLAAIRAEYGVVVRDNRAILVAQNYPSNFIAMFDDAVAWIKAATTGNGAQAFESAKDYERRNGGEYPYQDLANLLFKFSIELRHPPAQWEFIARSFGSSSTKDRRRGHRQLMVMAQSGNLEAALDLAHRHETSDTCAMFWYLRAATLGAGKEIDAVMKSMAQRVSSKDREEIRKRLQWVESDPPDGCEL